MQCSIQLYHHAAIVAPISVLRPRQAVRLGLHQLSRDRRLQCLCQLLRLLLILAKSLEIVPAQHTGVT